MPQVPTGTRSSFFLPLEHLPPLIYASPEHGVRGDHAYAERHRARRRTAPLTGTQKQPALPSTPDRGPRKAAPSSRRRARWLRGLVRSIRLSRRIGRERRHDGIHVVPRLGALDEDVGVWPEPARIVEGADPETDDVGPGGNLDVKRRAAVAAEDARDLVPGVGLGDVAFRRTVGDVEPGRWHAHRRDVRGAALQLAVPAVALQGELGFAGAFVSHRLAQASAGSGRHMVLPRLICDFPHSHPWRSRLTILDQAG